jgi:hypothetical protein
MIAALLLAAAAASPDLTICADRPTKANAGCTVPAGHWQLEVAAADWTRSSNGMDRTDVTSLGQALVKLGLTDNSDLELGFSPHIEIDSRAGALRDHESGIGDTVVRYKRRLTAEGTGTQFALIPFVKLPTARHGLGNGKAEGGLATTVSFATKAGPAITLGPEFDLLADSDGHGYHPGITNLVNVGISPAPRLSLSAELWNAINFDRPHTIRSWSADFAAAYLATKRLQIDGGANFGLNRATPDIELYTGISILF